MSSYKQFLVKDVEIAPFVVNKKFTFNREDFYTSSIDPSTDYKHFVGVNRFLGKNIPEPNLIGTGEPLTGNENIKQHYQKSIYNSIKTLYYSNFLTSSQGDPISFNISQHITGSIDTPNYYDYLSSTLTPNRYFPTGSNEEIGVISIPSTLFNEYIEPESFKYNVSGEGELIDDGEGNIIYDEEVIGNIIYEHGLIIITKQIGDTLISNFINDSEASIEFVSSKKMYEIQYKCVLRENEFNFSLNPTFINNIENNPPPYITSIGLYDNDKNLLAIAKTSLPIPKPSTTDLILIINLDI